MKICLVQYKPFYPKIGMLDSYDEVVASYVWGFAALGHEVKHRINSFDPDCLNIVFGWQIPSQLGLLDKFPADTIIFNFERYYNRPEYIKALTNLAGKYQIWDYSLQNLSLLNTVSPKFPPYYAKIAYAPNLEKVPTGVKQDIDVLYYGGLHTWRYDALRKVSETRGDLTGLSVMTLRNFWGGQRDEFIARSKIILHICSGDDIFEIVRVSYLLANKKAVVYCIHGEGDGNIENDLRNGALKLADTSEVDRICTALVEDDAARAQCAEQGYEVFRQRDIRDVIKNFFN